jgi:Tol biopolymer transport system component
MQKKIRSRLFLMLASMVLAALLGPTPASATFPGENGKVGFIGGGGISSINLDGSGTTNLVNSRANFIWESLGWSPDGSKLAFTSDGDGTDNYYDVFTVNADGSGFTNVSAHRGPAWSPSWSPDGSKLAYSNGIVYTVNADGSGFKGLTDGDGSGEPVWSPNGSKIAFDRNHDIYVMNADGSGQTRLTDTTDEEERPAWSPDGSEIAYVRRSGCRGPDGDYLAWPDSAGCYAIFVMNDDGTAQTRLTTGHGRPSWSPDGSKIAFVSYRNGMHIFYTINPDGSGETMLTHGAQNDNGDAVAWFAWSPDSSKLVLHREANSSIYLIDANGGGETFLTIGASPEWQPLVLSAFKNARKFCRAQREAQGKAAFRERYGRHAFRTCIRQAGRS